MGYAIGVDLGTTYTAAAVHRDGRGTIAGLGTRSPATPSVVYVGPDGTALVGDAAVRRALGEPHRVAREFKRRLGDPTPLYLDGVPHGPETLTARLVQWTVDEVAREQGGPPDRVVVTHPATWGPFRRDVLDEVLRIAEIDHGATLTEPEAAAVHYASSRPLGVGDVVAVYDLGGGTFDVTVIRRTVTGFEIVGRPDGIEHLGGLDFDAAVLDYVREALDGALDRVDPDGEGTTTALAQLHQDCVQAKEALSSDTAVEIPVFLPEVHTRVRLTRHEFEALVRPSLTETVEMVGRTVRAAGLEPDALSMVLLVGGSSRIPLVAELVASELGRPVTVDVHPKHAVALGAARWGSAQGVATAVAPPPRVRPTRPAPGGGPVVASRGPTALHDLVAPAPICIVDGVRCPAGHFNNPASSLCATCGSSLGRLRRRRVRGPRPCLGSLIGSDGLRHDLDADLVIGRDPRSHALVQSGTARPLPVPEEDLMASRLHALVRLDGWTATVTDLDTRNGTYVVDADSSDWARVERPGAVITPDMRILVGEHTFTARLTHR